MPAVCSPGPRFRIEADDLASSNCSMFARVDQAGIGIKTMPTFAMPLMMG